MLAGCGCSIGAQRLCHDLSAKLNRRRHPGVSLLQIEKTCTQVLPHDREYAISEATSGLAPAPRQTALLYALGVA